MFIIDLLTTFINGLLTILIRDLLTMFINELLTFDVNTLLTMLVSVSLTMFIKPLLTMFIKKLLTISVNVSLTTIKRARSGPPSPCDPEPTRTFNDASATLTYRRASPPATFSTVQRPRADSGPPRAASTLPSATAHGPRPVAPLAFE